MIRSLRVSIALTVASLVVLVAVSLNLFGLQKSELVGAALGAATASLIISTVQLISAVKRNVGARNTLEFLNRFDELELAVRNLASSLIGSSSETVRFPALLDMLARAEVISQDAFREALEAQNARNRLAHSRGESTFSVALRVRTNRLNRLVGTIRRQAYWLSTSPISVISRVVDRYIAGSDLDGPAEIYVQCKALSHVAGLREAEGNLIEAAGRIRAAIDVASRLIDLDSALYVAEFARVHEQASSIFAQIDEPFDALESSMVAVEALRQLVLDDPKMNGLTLAVAVHNLSNRFAEIGRNSDALTSVQEAEVLFSQHAPGGQYSNAMVTVLNTLCRRLSTVGDHDGAVRAAERAVSIAHKLAELDPDDDAGNYLLATSLANLATELVAIDAFERSVAAANEAVRLLLDLTEAGDQRTVRSTAMALERLSKVQSRIGNVEDGVRTADRAVKLRTNLPGDGHDSKYGVALALLNLGECLVAAERYAEAVQPLRRAVELQWNLLQDRPRRHLVDYVVSLNTLANALLRSGQKDEALRIAELALTLARMLDENFDGEHRVALAASLQVASQCFAAAGRRAEAIGLARDSVALRSELVSDYEGRYRGDFAASLDVLSGLLYEDGRYEESLKYARQSLDVYIELSGTSSDAYMGKRVQAARVLAKLLRRTGRSSEAQEVENDVQALLRVGVA